MPLFLFLSLFLSLVPLGQGPGDVRLTGTDGKDVFIQTDNHISIIVFLSPECPLCQNYTLTLNNLLTKYKNKNVQLFGIFPGTTFSAADIREFGKQYNVGFPLLLDEKDELVRVLSAKVTPEVFVLNEQSQVCYSGRIDNWAYEVSRKRAIVTEHNLEDAVREIVNHQPVKVSQTKAIGCFIE